jgi:CheY-like chemotaxis protein
MIPQQRPSHPEHLAAHAELRDLAAPATVLVVDDDAAIRELLGVMLEVEGHRVLQAACGAEALALVAQHRPDLITLDVMMPDMDGWEVADHLDADVRTAAIPRVMISGKPLGELQGAPGARRAAAVLSKPFDFTQVTRLVHELLAAGAVPQQRAHDGPPQRDVVLAEQVLD